LRKNAQLLGTNNSWVNRGNLSAEGEIQMRNEEKIEIGRKFHAALLSRNWADSGHDFVPSYARRREKLEKLASEASGSPQVG
jgi:hypothetical protein